MESKICKRCNRKIKANKSKAYRMGFGAVCWRKHKEESKPVSELSMIEKLMKKIEFLEQEVSTLKRQRGSTPPNGSDLIPLPNSNSNGSKIPLSVGGWDVSELQSNELFLKMKALSN